MDPGRIDIPGRGGLQGKVLAPIAILVATAIWALLFVHRVGEFKANEPALVIPSSIEMSAPMPYMDKFDPQILYLIQPLSGGAGLRIDLHTFKLSSCKFDLKDPDNIEESIKEADKFFNSFTLIYPRVQPHPIAWEEFRGRTFSHPAFHLYGYPVASEPGLRKAEPRFGDWFIIENQNGINVELIKLPVWNSETPGDLSMGQLYISPDKRWDVFISSGRSVVFLFDRAKARSAKIE